MSSKIHAILTIDIGLTNCKVSLFDLAGRLLGQVGSRYPTINPKPNWSEQRPGDWWKTIKKCNRALAAQPAWASVDILAISLTAHMHGMVAVDQERKPLTNCWTLFDRRAEQDVHDLNIELGERTAYRITGGRLEAYTPAAKIYWLRRNQPELFARTACFLSPKDYLRQMLGGEQVTDPVDAAGTLLYDLRRQCWSNILLEAVGVDARRLPEVRPASMVAGKLGVQAARQLNLKSGIPLLTGAGDDVEALGAGVIRPGQVLEHIGTTGTLIACTDRYVDDEQQAVEIYPHVVPGLYLVGGATNAAGRSLDWLRRVIDSDRKNADLLISGNSGQDEFPSPVFLPFILGERGLLWDGQATGMFLGLRENQSKAELARAVYEGVAFSLREILEAVRGMGLEVDQLVSGSSPKNEAWSRLRANIYGMAIHYPSQTDLTGLGAAMLALLGLGVYPDFASVARTCGSPGSRIDPDPLQAERYNYQWERYLTALRLGKQIFPLFYRSNTALQD
ncbi:MAG: hypothetical protein EHM70_13085 [Chloroflexota bacterium]|nr:MAG: hypothetical protein EHM70_13085 [Chloroflexota bacterium]